MNNGRNPNEFIVTTYSSKPKSQWVAEIERGIRIVHLPTGLSAECETERSQFKNRELAYTQLEKLIMNNDRRKTINSLISQLEEVLEAVNEVLSEEMEANENKPEGLQNDEPVGHLEDAQCGLEAAISDLGDAAV